MDLYSPDFPFITIHTVDGIWVKYPPMAVPPAHPPSILQGLRILTKENLAQALALLPSLAVDHETRCQNCAALTRTLDGNQVDPEKEHCQS